MTKYRIVKLGKYNEGYKVQTRYLFFFWINSYGSVLPCTLELCEQYIEDQIKQETIEKQYPRDIVVKTY
jgi:hypothetical protein